MINSSQTSGLKTGDGVIASQPCKLTSLIVGADGTNAATVILYDNASAASGNVLAKIVIDAGLTGDNFTPAFPIDALNGIYLDIGGTGAECVVHFQLG